MTNNHKMTNRLIVTILSLLMLFSAGPFFFADNMSAYADASVDSWATLKSAINNGGTITLTKDIVAEDTITIPDGVTITITGGNTIYSKAGRDKYDSMFKVESGGNLTIAEGTTLSGKTSDGSSQSCPDNNPYTADKFTGGLSEDGKTYEPKGFFIQVEGGGSATLNGTISDFVTSRNKATTPRYVAPVVANGANAQFDLGSTGVIKNNLVGYIVDDLKANNDAQSIKQYIKGAGPNIPRVPNAKTQKANSGNFDGRPRSKDAGIDGSSPGTGITATAGAVIYKGGAKGTVEGTIENNRADTGGIMASGKGTEVKVKEGTTITKNVGAQFGGGSTVEQGGRILMTGGTMSKNVAWFGGGAVFATENGVDWLLGRMSGDDGLHPEFDKRLDGEFFMEGGKLTENTAFTRGGAILADSDGVNINQGELSYNLGRMLGGAMYVMGDHPKYEYTVQMTGLYVHDNAAVSGESKARDATKAAPDSQILSDYWKPDGASTLTWNHLDAPLDTLLQAPTTCGDAGNILDGEVTGGAAKGNTDDWLDGTGAQGTGGGVWLCAYGNTIFDANEPDEVIITNNWATGAPGAPYNPSGAYHKTLGGSDLADAKVNSAESVEDGTGKLISRSGIAGGSDFHADTGGKGTVVINGLTDANWINENTKQKYESEVSNGRLNLKNANGTAMNPGSIKVNVFGNLARHGGGLAADGTYIFGTAGDQATPSATLSIEKKWINSVAKAPVTIKVTATTKFGNAEIADVPLDGEANPPATEFETMEELAPAGNTWKGRFELPMSISAENGDAKVYTLVYDGDENVTTTLPGLTVVKGMELDPLDFRGKTALGSVLSAGKKDDIKVLFGEPEYVPGRDPKIVDWDDVKKEYKTTPITFNFDEFKDDGSGQLIPCEDYIFTPGEINLSDIKTEISATPHKKSTYNPQTGEIEQTEEILYNIYLFEIPLTAPMTNDNWPLIEKYVNKKVHEDIVNFDQDFEYDIMAYVPANATEFTISDTLVNGLEFADKYGNPTKNPKEAIRSITVKYTNNHQTGEKGSVSDEPLHTYNTRPIDFMKWGVAYGEKYYPIMNIEDKTVSVKFDYAKPEDNRVFGINNAAESWLPGRWIQVTFGARIEDKYRSLDELKALSAEVEDKDNSWENDETDKQAPGAHDLVVANGDLDLVASLVSDVGPDPIMWAVPGPSRLFARSERGEYYATPMNDKSGNTWQRIDKNSDDEYFGAKAWKNADNRYNGRPPESYDTGDRIDLNDSKLAPLKKQALVIGHKLVKGAEGGSRLFVQTEDPAGNTHIFVNEDKTGAEWREITSADGDVYTNAINRLKPDSGTIRMLDLKTKEYTLKGDGKNWPVISEEEHEGMANQGKYEVKFGNGPSHTYKTNTVTVNPETQELEATKKWVEAKKDEIPSPEDFASFLILKANNEDVTEKYKDKLTVKDNKDFTYTAKWVGLPNLEGVDYSYEVDEEKIPGFTKKIEGLIITNTKTREEKPEIEKYVNQAVHKDIKLDEVFTYDIIAYITKDADSVTITDKLNDVLTFESKAEDIKVVDLGEDNNHLVTNNISNVEVNDNASVAQEGEPVDAAKVTVDGQDLKVFITNKMKVITEAYDPVEIETINPKKERYYEKLDVPYYEKTKDTDIVDGKEYYTESSGTYTLVANPEKEELVNYYEKVEYVLTKDTKPEDGKTYYTENGNEFSKITITPVNPKTEGYFEEGADGYVETEDEVPAAGKTYYEKKTITDGSRGYEYDGDEQPVTDLRGHWVKVTFNAKIKDGLKVEDVKKAFETINSDQVEKDRVEENVGNAPVVSAEDHTGIPNNAKYTIGVASEAGIQEDVYGDSSNTVTVKPEDETGGEDGTEPDDREGDEDVKPDNDEEGDDSKVKGADTGDDTEMMPWMLLFIASAAAVTTGAVYRRKRSR